MRLCIYGTDKRSECLRQIASEKGYLLTDIRPDVVVMPLPRAKLSDVKRMFPKGQIFICGTADDAFAKEARQNHWLLHPVLADETFQQANAQLTAEAALYKAMAREKGALCKKKCMVIGYGRIGRALVSMLRGLACKTRVAARRAETRREAGEGSIAMNEIENAIRQMDWIFNTVPSPVISTDALKNMKEGATVMELASPPYGLDMAEAERLGVQVQLEGGLPGRYCPRDAAEAWMEYIERSVGK